MPLSKIQKRSLLFWLLHNEYGKTQVAIAQFLGVTQSTVSSGLKEANYLLSLNEAQKQIEQLRSQLLNEFGPPQTGLSLFLNE